MESGLQLVNGNPRRWQPSARKEHKTELENLISQHPDMIVDRCSEAHGINVTELMHELGVGLEWSWPFVHDITNKIYFVSLVGYRL